MTIRPATTRELDQFETHLNDFTAGRIDFEEFRKIRVWQGVYSFRGTTDRYMVRIKIPQGRLDAAQLSALADLAAKYSQNGGVHVTTRQDVEFYAVSRDDLMPLLRALAAAGITTRATGGNGVRNITLCPRAGIAPDEAFDVTPYAQALGEYFAAHPLAQSLPRKVKMAFEGCPDDHVRGMVHDIGAYAVAEGTRRGFQIYVGGGLGAAPRAAQLLEAFTPGEHLLATCEAILSVFHQHGNRASRDRSRLKFLVQDWGMDRFREEVTKRRAAILSDLRFWPELAGAEAPPARRSPGSRVRSPASGSPTPRTPDPALRQAQGAPSLSRGGPRTPDPRWLEYNVFKQKQSGFVAVFVRCRLGDIAASQMKTLAEVADEFCGGRIRTTTSQNFLLRWVREADLSALHRALEPHGLADCCAERVMDLTRCAGSDSCLSALTHSRALADELDALLANGFSRDADIMQMVVKISGCPHACSQHPIADLGLHGASRTIDGRPVPCYQLLVGGRTGKGHVQFATPLQLVPARNAPSAVKRLLDLYLDRRRADESFSSFVDRIGSVALRDELKAFATLPPYAEAPDLYKDWGSDEDYRIEARKGECYA